MADVEPKDTNINMKTTDDLVFDFSSDEFARKDLINAFHDMSDGYIRLSKSFKEVKVDNNIQRDKLNKSSYLWSENLNSFEPKVNLLTIENDSLRIVFKINNENIRLMQLVNS